MKLRTLVFLGSATLLGCGNDVSHVTGATSGAGGGAGGATSSSGAGAGVPGGWQTLVMGDWSLAPGTEDYVCVGVTVPETMYVSAFRPIAPDGTHHTVLSRSPLAVNGTFPCDAGTNGENMIYGSGVGTNPLELPAGVAVKLEAGDALLLNLHLFNTATSTLQGSSGVEVKRIEPAAVEHEAESLLAGTLSIDIPPQSQVTVSGHCTLPAATTVFAVAPHMHQLGTHMKVTVTQPSGATVIHDAAYSFDAQAHYLLPTPITTGSGADVLVECTYDNPTPAQVGFGDSSLDEMCFSGLFLHPARGLPLICAD